MKLSEFVAGFWRLKHWGLSNQELLTFMDQCIELGVTTMDHAMVYGSEKPFGDALALNPQLRDNMKIVTKCGIRPCGFGDLGAEHTNFYDSSKQYIIASLEASLKNLRTDYVDVLLIHRPDYLMDIEEVADAFDSLKAQGKVRAFGVSNFSVSQFDALQSACADPLLTNQIEYSPAAMQALDNGVFDQCSRYRINPMLWSCLGAGEILSPKSERGVRILNALQAVADQVNAETIEQVVYAWVLSLPCNPRVLVGSSKIERVRIAVKSKNIKISREQWYQIWEASNGASVP